MRRPLLKLATAVAALALLPGWLWQKDTLPRHEANAFVVQTLSKQSGKVWERLGRFVFFDYAFDATGCEFTVTRHAEFGEDFKQIIPMSRAQVTGITDSDLVFDCAHDGRCITHQVRNLVLMDDRQMVRTRVPAMDPEDLLPVANALNELHRLCSNPYGRAEFAAE